MATPSSVDRNLLPANRPALARGLAFVGLVGLVGAGVILAMRERLPDPLATSFGVSTPGGTTPDGYTTITGTAVVTLCFTLLLGGLFTATGAMVPGRRWARRLAFGLGIGLAVVVASAFVATTLAQRDLATAADARLDWGVFLVPVIVAIAVGWVASALIRE